MKLLGYLVASVIWKDRDIITDQLDCPMQYRKDSTARGVFSRCGRMYDGNEEVGKENI